MTKTRYYYRQLVIFAISYITLQECANNSTMCLHPLYYVITDMAE
jgi:hypothetical protein